MKIWAIAFAFLASATAFAGPCTDFTGMYSGQVEQSQDDGTNKVVTVFIGIEQKGCEQLDIYSTTDGERFSLWKMILDGKKRVIAEYEDVEFVEGYKVAGKIIAIDGESRKKDGSWSISHKGALTLADDNLVESRIYFNMNGEVFHQQNNVFKRHSTSFEK